MDLKESKVENLWRKLNSAEAQSARWDATMLAYFKKKWMGKECSSSCRYVIIEYMNVAGSKMARM